MIYNNMIQTNRVIKVGAAVWSKQFAEDADDDLLGMGDSISPPAAI